MKGTARRMSPFFLMFWFALKENKTGGKLDLFCIFTFCAVHIEIPGAGPVSTPFTWCRTNWTNYCTNTSRFCPEIFLPAANPSTYTELRLTPTCTFSSICKTSLSCQLCPTKAGNFPTPHGNFCGEIIFSPCLFGFGGKWDLTVMMGWHKKRQINTFCEDCSWRWFPGCFLGSWCVFGDVAEKGPGTGQSMNASWPDRQTHRHTHSTVFI